MVRGQEILGGIEQGPLGQKSRVIKGLVNGGFAVGITLGTSDSPTGCVIPVRKEGFGQRFLVLLGSGIEENFIVSVAPAYDKINGDGGALGRVIKTLSPDPERGSLEVPEGLSPDEITRRLVGNNDIAFDSVRIRPIAEREEDSTDYLLWGVLAVAKDFLELDKEKRADFERIISELPIP